MLRPLLVFAFLATQSGCSPYPAMQERLNADFRAGRISAHDYWTMSMDLDRRNSADAERFKQSWNTGGGGGYTPPSAMDAWAHSVQGHAAATAPQSQPSQNTYNPMTNQWRYAPPGSQPRYNPMSGRWEMVPQ